MEVSITSLRYPSYALSAQGLNCKPNPDNLNLKPNDRVAVEELQLRCLHNGYVYIYIYTLYIYI